MKQVPEIALKRVYEPPAAGDGQRILVERLWPRGVSKADAAIDEWFKEIAPSTELRKWYNHQPERWEVFQQKYRAELAQKPDGVRSLYQLCQEKPVTFVFAAKDTERNSAQVLKAYIQNWRAESTDTGTK